MSATQWALAILGGVIGVMLYRLARWAISEATARKRAPDNDLPVTLTLVNRRRLLVLLTDAVNIGGSDIWRYGGGPAADAYGFLDRLEGAGLVTSRQEAPEEREDPLLPCRRFYRLTPEGRAAAMKALRLREGVRS